MKENVEEYISQNHPEEIQEHLNQKKETNKSMVGMIIAVILVSIGIGVYYLVSQGGGDEAKPTPISSPTPTPSDIQVIDPDNYDTSDWIVYTNSSLNISLKYPNDWEVTEHEDYFGLRTKKLSDVYGDTGVVTLWFDKEAVDFNEFVWNEECFDEYLSEVNQYGNLITIKRCAGLVTNGLRFSVHNEDDFIVMGSIKYDEYSFESDVVLDYREHEYYSVLLKILDEIEFN